MAAKNRKRRNGLKKKVTCPRLPALLRVLIKPTDLDQTRMLLSNKVASNDPVDFDQTS